MFMGRTVLVTGSSGFIGRHVAHYFSRKNIPVVGLDRNPSDNSVVVDLKDTSKLAEIFRKYRPYCLIHLASELVSVPESVLHPEKSDRDVTIAKNLFSIAAASGTGQIIFASSAHIYGNPDSIPTSETAPIRILSPYGKSKYAIERELEHIAKTGKITKTIVRYFNVYGPGQTTRTHAAIPTIISRAVSGKNIVIRDGYQTRDFVYVEDVAEANYRAYTMKAGGVYNIASGTKTSIRSLVEMVETLHKQPLRIQYKTRHAHDIFQSLADISYAQENLKWTPRTGLMDGLRKTYTYYETIVRHQKETALSSSS